MPSLSPPRQFCRDLARFDKDLRCRWSNVRDCFLIERKLRRGQALMGGVNADIAEHEAAADGYLILFEVDREALDERVFYTLWSTDIERQGGAVAVSDKIDAAYWKARAKSREEFRYYITHHARERFNYWNTIRCLPETHAHTAPEGGMSVNG